MALGIPNLERIVSNFLEGGTGITAIRNIEFDKNYLWTVDFLTGDNEPSRSIKPPAPFDQIFPASDVSINVASLTSGEFDTGMSTVKYPKGTRALDMSITFYDDETRTLLKWFRDWINVDILNNGKFISGFDDDHEVVGKRGGGEVGQNNIDIFSTLRPDNSDNTALKVFPTRVIRIALLDAFKKETQVMTYRVYPDGDLTFVGSQASQATQYTINFVIVADLTSKYSGTNEIEFGTEAKRLLGRFL